MRIFAMIISNGMKVQYRNIERFVEMPRTLLRPSVVEEAALCPSHRACVGASLRKSIAPQPHPYGTFVQ